MFIITARPMGIIITVVAVLEIHMDKNAVAIINPRMRRFGVSPMTAMITRAILLWRCHRCMAKAMKNPPMNRKMRGLAYGAAAVFASEICKRGKNATGRRDVAGMGMASVIHQVAMRSAMAAIFWASGVIPAGVGTMKRMAKMRGPRKRPTPERVAYG